MTLLTTLNEASAHAIDDLKKILSKDDRTKIIFNKGADLENIQDKKSLLATLKFFVLNNRNVIEFVNSRSNVKDMSKTVLKKLRELRPEKLTQTDVHDIQDFLSALFREHSYVERSGMSPHLRKEIMSWVNGNGTYFSLSPSAKKELESLPNVRPTRPTLLYRGLLFSGSSLSEYKRYDGQLETGAGLKFLRSIREGTRIVDLTWDRASSWTTDRKIAEQFARFRSAKSSHEATMNWLSRGKDVIDGDLGFVISTLAQPEDVLIDVARMNTQAHFQHGGEGEFILKPGSYTCRVSTKYTKTGEVDPIASTQKDETVMSAVEAVKSFAKSFDLSDYKEIGGAWNHLDIRRILRNKEVDLFKKLSSKEMKARVLSLYGNLKEVYDSYIAALKPEQLDSLVGDRDIGRVVKWMKRIHERMETTAQHQAFKSDKNLRGKVAYKEMSPSQVREAGSSMAAEDIRTLAADARYTDRQVGELANSMLSAFGKQQVPDLHRKGKPAQQEAFDDILDGFFKTMNVTHPTDREEAVKALRTAFLATERNARLLDVLHGYYEDLTDALKNTEDASKTDK